MYHVKMKWLKIELSEILLCSWSYYFDARVENEVGGKLWRNLVNRFQTLLILFTKIISDT